MSVKLRETRLATAAARGDHQKTTESSIKLPLPFALLEFSCIFVITARDASFTRPRRRAVAKFFGTLYPRGKASTTERKRKGSPR